MNAPPPIKPLPDPGPRPPLAGERLLVYVIKHLHEQQAVLDQLNGRGEGFIQKYERQAKWAHWLMIGEATLMLGSRLSTVFIASYIAYEHTWYVEKVVRFFHGLF